MAETLRKRSELSTVTPMMQQYLDVKNQYEGYILLYRLGDFYECFFEDACTASETLDLTLTGRDCGDGKRAAMCGVPFHKADLYIGKLVERGFKVAVCEQTEDPKAAVGLVKREVIRVVTPGTVTDGELLTEGKNNYLAAFAFEATGIGCAFADISTGEISVTVVPASECATRLLSEVGTYNPAEVLLNVAEKDTGALSPFLHERIGALVSTDASLFDGARCARRVREVFEDKADKLENLPATLATGALLAYIDSTQKHEVSFVRDLRVYDEGQYLELDLSTRRNLELTETMRGKEKRGSLLWVLDKTVTAAGARLLRAWITKPLVNPAHITRRQSAVADILSDRMRADELREMLAPILDIERLTAKAVYGTANAKDLRAIATSIAPLPAVKVLLSEFPSETLRRIAEDLDPLEDLFTLLDRALVENPPFTVREGGMIAPGYNEDVDYYRNVKNDADGIMASIAEREKEETGIRTLKVDYNKVFGYYIEVSKSFVNQVPARYTRKQTLTTCERYITQELKDMESTIFGADTKLADTEYALFVDLRDRVCAAAERLRSAASYLAEVDVYRAFAEVAGKNAYVCPEVDLSTELQIKDGRHPVVEKFVTDSYFVPNDAVLDTRDNRMMIITGPNMAGKSTYMRQVALIVLMAQIGSFVPAREARIGVVDRIFTRVGASDDLASGQSTFMLEMNEVAAILKGATSRSLIVYDEVGRGTSTYDGMAIAKAVIEYTLSKKIGAKTLFATHYHELISMEGQYPGVVNYNVAAKKRGDSVIFLRKIVRGGTDDSYGIEVAKLAGVPNEVVKRAKEILAEIECGGAKTVVVKESAPADLLSSLSDESEHNAAEEIRALDINTVTPIEAMNLLFRLKQSLS